MCAAPVPGMAFNLLVEEGGGMELSGAWNSAV